MESWLACRRTADRAVDDGGRQASCLAFDDSRLPRRGLHLVKPAQCKVPADRRRHIHPRHGLSVRLCDTQIGGWFHSVASVTIHTERTLVSQIEVNARCTCRILPGYSPDAASSIRETNMRSV